ncbi:MAG TPA: NUDIX domain-containing protein [Solirubrobacteraceae bacterium]|nr:NUDIX domain-containing protein [Solirubrobacteraceae bacterium]
MRPEDAIARLPVPARRLAYRAAHRVLSVWWVVRRPHMRGVKCVLRHDGHVLFVRHTYGDRTAWELPGGGLRRGEAPADAAAREAREELGVHATWTQLATIHARGGPKVTTLTVFVADLPGPGASGPAERDRSGSIALTIDPGEIAEARWAPLDAPPAPLAPLARCVVDRLRAG